jgi:uncharacterized protein YuzE
MKIRYFEDTDTALVEFSSREVAETKEISENVYADMDAAGNLVSMTIEHARQNANLPEVAYESMARRA